MGLTPAEFRYIFFWRKKQYSYSIQASDMIEIETTIRMQGQGSHDPRKRPHTPFKDGRTLYCVSAH
jgi:hypothetical protein